ncbi:MAG: cytidylate kinase family protein [Rhodospirillaceae bacterium]
MTVLAMSMEMGALSKEVAEEVANELGLKIVYDAVVDAITSKLGTTKTSVCRFIEGRTNWMERLCVPAFKLDAVARAELLTQTLAGGTLVRGWGGEALFARIPAIPRVRLCAPVHQRIANLRTILGMDDEDYLRAEVARSDASYASRLWIARGSDRRPAFEYDLVINTARNSVDACVDQILRLVRQPRFRVAQATDPALRAETLRAVANAALMTDPRTARVRIGVEVRPRCIILNGVVRDDEERRATEDVVRAATRVEDIRNRLTAMNRDFQFIRSTAQY